MTQPPPPSGGPFGEPPSGPPDVWASPPPAGSGQPGYGGQPAYGAPPPGAYGQPAYPGQGYGPGGPAPGRTEGLAIGSLVCGIVGLFLCPVVLSVTALVLGVRARRRIDASGGALGGRGMATAGLVLGVVGLVIGLVVIALIALGAFSGPSGGSRSGY